MTSTPDDTIATDDPVRDGDSAQVSQFVDGFVRELAAYRKETRIYPSQHPRLRERIQNLHTELWGFVKARGDLRLEVRNDVLLGQGVPLEGSRSAGELASIFRERLLRSVTFGMGVTIRELRKLVEVLLQDTEMAREDEGESSSPHIQLERFDHFFAGPSADDLAWLGQLTGADEGDIAGVTEGVWKQFSREQLASVKKILTEPHVREKLANMGHLSRRSDNSLDFISNFFELLRKDPLTDWRQPGTLESSIISGLEVVEEACREKEERGSISTELLAPGADTPLSSHFRWRLLRGFFPEEVSGSSPRQAEDLSFSTTSTRGQWALEEPGQADWGETPIESLRDPFQEQFESAALLSELVLLNVSLAELSDLDFEELRGPQKEILRRHLEQEEQPDRVLGETWQRLQVLPLGEYGNYLLEILSQYSPEKAVQVISGGEAELLKDLLRRPPDLTTEPDGDPSEPSSRSRELLRRVLARRDSFALTLSQWVLSRADVDLEAKFAWMGLFKELLSGNPEVPIWLRENSELLFQPSKVLILVGIPFPLLREELLRHLEQQTDAKVCGFFEAFKQYSSSQALNFLRIGLDLGPAVRRTALEGLAFQGDRCLDVLESILLRHSEGRISGSTEDEIDVICRGLARYGGPAGRELLTRVDKEKSGLTARWARPVRKAAKRALKSGGRS